MENRINEVMAGFNFDRVHKAMTALDWKWQGKSPSLENLKTVARKLLVRAEDNFAQDVGANSSSTGGFQATRDKSGLWLEFTVESSGVEL